MSGLLLLPQPLNSHRLRKGPKAEAREAATVDPGSLLGSGFHELIGANTGAETTLLAFAISGIAGARARDDQRLCVCSLAADAQEYGTLYGHGVGGIGFPPDRLLMVSAEKEKHLLWTLEEALASRAFGAVIGVLGATERLYGFPESRRLKLRAVETGTPLYLLRHHSRGGATAAHGRWRVAAAPSRAGGMHGGVELLGPPRLRLTLEKLNGLPPQQWEMDYDVTRGFRMAAVLPDRVDRAADERRRQAL
jgi:protein ImuA